MLQIKKLTQNSKLPTRRSKHSAGYDLYSSKEMVIPPRSHAVVPTDISIKMPRLKGLELVGLIKSQYGFSTKNGIEHGAGVIDSDYTGPIDVMLHNYSNKEFLVKKHMRIAQILILNVLISEIEEIKEIEVTEREAGDFRYICKINNLFIIFFIFIIILLFLKTT